MGKREVFLLSRDVWAALPRGTMGSSAVCDCGISWSYSLTLFGTCNPMMCRFWVQNFGAVIRLVPGFYQTTKNSAQTWETSHGGQICCLVDPKYCMICDKDTFERPCGPNMRALRGRLLSESSSIVKLYVCDRQRLRWVCTYARAWLSLPCWRMW